MFDMTRHRMDTVNLRRTWSAGASASTNKGPLAVPDAAGRSTMKRALVIVGLAVLIGVTAVAVAGDKHCNGTTQECLDKMVAKIQQKGWLGVDAEKLDNGRSQVTKVYSDSPAQRAGFKPGDVFISINGVDMTDENKEALMKVKHSLGPGSDVNYVIKRQGGKVNLTAQLGSVPNAVLAEWVGEHMVTNHSTTKLASK